MKLFNGNDIDWKAYEVGRAANLSGDQGLENPYEKETDAWFSWNRGWNDLSLITEN